jgi:hypothetical protein
MRDAPITPRILAAKPIIFYCVKEISDFLKFKRRNVVVNPTVLKQACEFLGIENEESLEQEITSGVMNDRTTIYYLYLHPNYDVPVLPKLEQNGSFDHGRVQFQRVRSPPELKRPIVRLPPGRGRKTCDPTDKGKQLGMAVVKKPSATPRPDSNGRMKLGPSRSEPALILGMSE